MSDVNNRNSLSGSCESEIKVPAELVLSEDYEGESVSDLSP